MLTALLRPNGLPIKPKGFVHASDQEEGEWAAQNCMLRFSPLSSFFISRSDARTFS
jgi:hypothetical protein